MILEKAIHKQNYREPETAENESVFIFMPYAWHVRAVGSGQYPML